MHDYKFLDQSISAHMMTIKLVEKIKKVTHSAWRTSETKPKQSIKTILCFKKCNGHGVRNYAHDGCR